MNMGFYVMNKKMIVIEGLDGSGKSTQVELLKSKLIDNNIKVFNRASHCEAKHLI